jgi:hypothetical protein
MRLEYESDQFTAAMDTIKAVTFGNPNIVLHRREMLDATPPFQALQNSVVRGHLDTMLLKLLAEGTYRVFTVVIDKKEHLKKYVVWRFHPYHYCLTVCWNDTFSSLIESNKWATYLLNRAAKRKTCSWNVHIATSTRTVRLTSQKKYSRSDLQVEN